MLNSNVVDSYGDAFVMVDECLERSKAKRHAERLASVVASNLFFMGSVSSLIPHLKNGHGLSLVQIESGIDWLISDYEPMRAVFNGWQKYY